ncbi:hypothetical protein B0H15DRAFT_827498 [Mycena belliarum]|uniref:Uncharacterized protein n=1 Tax=Mycena belliarum TaxID=1033014 RepID=A0AAD6XSD9_9AGAR|nr:hypothetical protein B0H15DRAFT_827498 [Mycena belliae]
MDSSPDSPLSSSADSLTRPRRLLRRTTSSISLLSSSSKITLDFPSKADPSVYLTVRGGRHALGAFCPTPDAASALQPFARRTPKRLWLAPASPAPGHPPLRPLSIPSISRTVAFAASPVSPATEPLLDFDRDYTAPKRALTTDGTPPALAALERRSRLCTARVFCATCRAPGTNFPACARCASAWCSRECRLAGGKRHVCLSSEERPLASAPAPRVGATRTGISNAPFPVPVPIPRAPSAPMSATPIPKSTPEDH